MMISTEISNEKEQAGDDSQVHGRRPDRGGYCPEQIIHANAAARSAAGSLR